MRISIGVSRTFGLDAGKSVAGPQDSVTAMSGNNGYGNENSGRNNQNSNGFVTHYICQARMKISEDKIEMMQHQINTINSMIEKEVKEAREEHLRIERDFENKLVKACQLQSSEMEKSLASIKAYIAGALAAATVIMSFITFIMNFAR